tara:strand:- start:1906 stop:3381 length:1476 start_codon:yes stop_codon:yes gene_type:complete
MLDIGLIGNNFSHLKTDDGIYSMTDNRKPLFTRWVDGEGSDITLFLDDNMFNYSVIDSVSSKYKVGMILETPEINPKLYSLEKSVIDRFDFILTYSNELVESNPKFVWYPFGGSWILEDYIGLYEKSKSVNMLFSNKTTTSGHRLRHEIANTIDEIDLFGSGCNKPFDSKEEVLAPYMFSIVIENTKLDNYFSEKILDCFATGTIPIYWGSSSVCKNFNCNGILMFNTIDQLREILNTDLKKYYHDNSSAIRDNAKKVKEYYCQEDWLYKNVFYNLNLNESYEIVDCSPDDSLAFVDGNTQAHWLSEFANAGGDDILYEFNLDNKSIVFDTGTYECEYANEIVKRYGCKVHTFEPVKDFYNKYKDNGIGIHNNFALGKDTCDFYINLCNDASFEDSSGKLCKKVSFTEYISQNNIDSIDLIKINIEGGEYELLKEIINSNNICNVKNILVQFHPLKRCGAKQRQIIIDELEKTHEKSDVYFPFVWEHWKKK